MDGATEKEHRKAGKNSGKQKQKKKEKDKLLTFRLSRVIDTEGKTPSYTLYTVCKAIFPTMCMYEHNYRQFYFRVVIWLIQPII